MQKDSGGKGGVIVNISSVAGLHSLSQFPVYSATKHAVVSFSRSFAVSINDRIDKSLRYIGNFAGPSKLKFICLRK